jgi:hypothetical protein
MTAEAVFRGAIPQEGVRDVLGGLEEIGTTGVFAFESESGSGMIHLLHGQIATNGAGEDAESALETLLSLRDGRFAVYPKLPHLPVSRGTDTTRRGSLAVHPPAELMRYCEKVGLTGRLLLEHRGRIAIGYYERGELTDVSIDGGTPADFVTALEWTEGTFRVDAVPPPRETLPPSLQSVASARPPKDPTQLPSSVQAAEQDPGESLRPDDTLVSARRPWMEEQDEDATIRIVRRPGSPELDRPRELWSTLDYSPSFAEESATTAPVKTKDDGRPMGFWRTLGWVGAVFVVVAGCLWLLASLPPLE